MTHSLVPHSLLWLTSWPESDPLCRSIFFPLIVVLVKECLILSNPFLPGTYREPTVIPNIQTFRFTMKHFPFHVSCSKYSCLLYWTYWMFSWYSLQSFLSTFITIPIAPVITGIIKHFMFHIRCTSSHKLVQFLLFCFHFRSVSVCSYSHIYQDACFVFVFFVIIFLLLSINVSPLSSYHRFWSINSKWWPSHVTPSPQSLTTSPTVSDSPRTLTPLNSLTLITALLNPSLQQSNHSPVTDGLDSLPLSLINP